MPEIDFASILKEDAAQTIAPPADAIPPADAPVVEKADPTPAPGDDAPETPIEAPKPKKSVEERISTITAKRREAERERDQARAEKQELLDRLTRTTRTDDPFDPNKFTSLEDRDKAIAEAAERKVRAEIQAEQTKKEVDGFWSSLEKDGKGIEDFDDTVEALRDPKFPISDVMARYLVKRSTHKAQLGKWLADNRGEAERIFALEPDEAVIEMARRDGLVGRSAKPVTKAPPPPPSVTGATGGSTSSLENMSHDDIKKWAREQQR